MKLIVPALLLLALPLSALALSTPATAPAPAPRVATPGIGDIVSAIGRGQADALLAQMDSEVELSILDDEDVYGKQEAVQRLREFFGKVKPTAFNQVHQGSSKADDAEYVIGNLTTASGSYRVYVYVAVRGGQQKLQELRIDRE